MNEIPMKKRVKELAGEIIKFCRKLPDNRETRLTETRYFFPGLLLFLITGLPIEQDQQPNEPMKYYQ